MPSDPFIPFHRPSIGDEEIDEVARTLRSGWITSGPQTARFEQEFRDYTGGRNALAVNSCTAGLHLALAALGIGPGDEVVTTPLTFCATVNSVLHVGATPVLADTLPDGNIDPESVSDRITARTRAIIPVHLGGLPCHMDALQAIARRHGLFVIEDAAHAAGSKYRGRMIGSGSDAVAFSFYATKNLTTGEGGMVTCDDPQLADRMRVLCLHGITKDAWNRYAENGSWYYQIVDCGFKYNLSDIQSAIGIHQLHKLEGFLEVRQAYARLYNQILGDAPEIELPPGAAEQGSRHAWHLYMIRLNLGRLDIDRAEFIRELHRAGIGTSVHFIPIPSHPCYSDHAGCAAVLCPAAMALYPRLISLPLYPAMTEDQVAYVARTVRDLARKHRTSRSVAVPAGEATILD